MRRKLWIVTMALVAIFAATGPQASASAIEPGYCRASGSLCTNGQDCCSQICDCNDAQFTDGSGCYCQ